LEQIKLIILISVWLDQITNFIKGNLGRHIRYYKDKAITLKLKIGQSTIDNAHLLIRIIISLIIYYITCLLKKYIKKIQFRLTNGFIISGKLSISTYQTEFLFQENI
jgi:hypothetical protein